MERKMKVAWVEVRIAIEDQDGMADVGELLNF